MSGYSVLRKIYSKLLKESNRRDCSSLSVFHNVSRHFSKCKAEKSQNIQETTLLNSNRFNIHTGNHPIYSLEENESLWQHFNSSGSGYSKAINNLQDKYYAKMLEFADIFKCSEDEVCHLFLKYNFLTRSKSSTLRTKVDFLLKEGIKTEELKNDLHVLTYTISKLNERIDLLKKLNVTPVKTWMLRCNKEVVLRTSKHREDNRAAMEPYSNLIDFLCQRLLMSENQISSFATKHPPVMRVQIAKLKEIMDFLFLEGFTAAQIYHTPRILCHSLETIQERLSALRKRDYEPYSLALLCKSKRKFLNILRKLDSST